MEKVLIQDIREIKMTKLLSKNEKVPTQDIRFCQGWWAACQRMAMPVIVGCFRCMQFFCTNITKVLFIAIKMHFLADGWKFNVLKYSCVGFLGVT